MSGRKVQGWVTGAVAGVYLVACGSASPHATGGLTDSGEGPARSTPSNPTGGQSLGGKSGRAGASGGTKSGGGGVAGAVAGGAGAPTAGVAGHPHNAMGGVAPYWLPGGQSAGGAGGALLTGGTAGVVSQAGMAGTGLPRVPCQTPTDCPGVDGDCRYRDCIGHFCAQITIAAGSLANRQAAGDCNARYCDASGQSYQSADPADPPATTVCAVGACNNGVPNIQPQSRWLDCGGATPHACDGLGNCLEAPQFTLLRVGDGTITLDSSAVAATLERVAVTGTAILTLSILPLPVTGTASTDPVTFAGSATREGLLSLSPAADLVEFLGYAAVPGLTNPAGRASSTTPRLLGRVGASGQLATLRLPGTTLSRVSPGGVTGDSNGGFWFTGQNGQILWLNGGGTAVSLLADSAHAGRAPFVGAGQLYLGTDAGIFRVGTGLPTSGTQTVTAVAGLTLPATPSVCSTVWLAPSPETGHQEALFLADDSGSQYAGVQKWVWASNAWQSAGTVTLPGGNGACGLAAQLWGGAVVVLASAAVRSQNDLVLVEDTGAGLSAPVVVRTAGSNMAYRGVAVAPR